MLDPLTIAACSLERFGAIISRRHAEVGPFRITRRFLLTRVTLGLSFGMTQPMPRARL